MTTPKNARRRILPLALLAAATTLALTACGGATGTSASGAGTVAAPTASSSGAASGAASVGASGAASAGAGAASSAASASATPSRASTGGQGGGNGGAAVGSPISSNSGGGDASSDSYAYKHVCQAGQLSLKVSYDAQLGPTKRLIAVTDTGSKACGLSYYPVVAIDNSATVNSRTVPVETVQPKVPSGLGGAPYYALYSGRTAYAVVDLDPSHSTAGAARIYDALTVIANENLPLAEAHDTTIVEEGGGTGNPYVKSPFLGLYESSIAGAVASANPANG
jgi:hypothetical protein